MYVKRLAFFIETNPLMLCSETMAGYCQKNGLQVRNANPGGISTYHWEFNS
jgi:hypothetical protein